MKRIATALVLFVFVSLSMPGHAQVEAVGEMTAADQAAIRQVVSDELFALQHDNEEQAFFHLSPRIREHFGSADVFFDMVRTVHFTIYRSRDMQFRTLEATYYGPVQTVFFIGPQGEAALGLYFMQQQDDGSWKINGCKLTTAPDITI